MSVISRLWGPLALLGIATCAAAQLMPNERQGIQDALYLGNLTTDDLVFARRPFNDPYRFPIVDLAIDRPLDAADRLLALHSRSLKRSVSQLISVDGEGLFDERVETVLPARPTAAPPSEVPRAVQASVAALASAVWRANQAVSASLDNLTEDERTTLFQSLPQWAAEEPSITFGWVTRKQAPQDEILRLVSRVNLSLMRAAAAQLAADVNAEMAVLRQAAVGLDWRGFASFTYLGLRIDVAGVGDDSHRSLDSQLTLDLGGNDRYLGRAGGGMGSCSLLIDLAGDDTYKVPDLSTGAGLLGIGMAYDLAGLDVFRGKSLCFGAGLAGVGVLFKDGGHDTYQSSAMTQGFGEFGLGLLLDTRGNDTYNAQFLAQGAARTRGVGWIQDRQGSDTYKCGGLVLNSPLFEDVYYSMGQGYAGGYREDTGGISGGVGLLTDAEGDDAYLGETYCQAASYWFSLGSTWDGGGHDAYKAYHYAQASAMHMTAGYLFDMAGDDLYAVAYGAAHAIGHDYGTAFLLDRAGSDVYAARDSRPAIGNANGLGMFVDSHGDDRYFGPPGYSNPARGSGSLAVFADLQGADVYRDGLADGQGAVRPDWAVAFDGAEPPAAEAVAAPSATTPQPGSRPRPSDQELADLYRKATQWGVGTAAKEVGESIHALVEVGMPALEWMVSNRLAKADRLQMRAFQQVVGALGAPARALMAARVASSDENEARVALQVCADGGILEADAHLVGVLENPRLARYGARAAMSVGGPASTSALVQLVGGQDRIAALFALTALARIKDPGTYDLGVDLLNAPELPIRKASMSLVAGFPDRARQTAENLISLENEHLVRLGIELLGRLGTEEALMRTGSLLSDVRPGVRMDAMQALAGRTPEPFKQAMLDLRKDTHPLVRALAARLQP